MRANGMMRSMGLGILCVGVVAASAIVRIEARPRTAATPQAGASTVAVDADNIGGVVTSSKGPEAGVWVIAETNDLGTKYRKIVVTNDQGQYLLPELPKANFEVWVRGYGLVDSQAVDAKPGQTLALKAVVAPNQVAAAQYYPADYWYSMIKIPTKSAFPMNVPPAPPLPNLPGGAAAAPANLTHGYPPAPPKTAIQNQAEWLYIFKAGCLGCHMIGQKSTREIPAKLGTFKSSTDAWEHFLLSGQVGRSMLGAVNHLGHDQGLAMYADWGDRIARGEVPPTPPRPQGVERNVVLTEYDWSERASFLHALISTDKRNPTVNANGGIFGAVWSSGMLAEVDPAENTKAMIPVPLPNEADRPKLPRTSPRSQVEPSLYFADELVWDDPVNPGPITMDEKGRVWFNVENRIGNADFCKAGSKNPFAINSPREFGAKGVDVYDP
ncbi:MAG: carboxypeptidase-like regulatory domain-containing protein, partial [Candidatus Acidiferrales bacterium]